MTAYASYELTIDPAIDHRARLIGQRTGFLDVDPRILRALALIELCRGVPEEFVPVQPAEEWSPYPVREAA